MRALVATILVLAAPVALSEAQADRVTAGSFLDLAPAFLVDASLQASQPADGTTAEGSSPDGDGGVVVAEVSIVPGGPVVAESSARDGVARASARRVVITSR